MAAGTVALLVFGAVVIFLILKRLFWKSSVPSLENKHVMVTGGSSGIGLATAIECARSGAHVTLIARDEAKLKAALSEVTNAAKDPTVQKIQWISLDVTQDSRIIAETIRKCETENGPVYLLVNCAGTAVCGKLADATDADFKQMMNINYFGTVFPTQVVAASMKQRREGHIVITGSQASLLGIFGMSAYCASKFALRGFAEAIHMELAPHNVSVTMCLPPDTNTPGFENEEKSKPAETKLISETAGLAEPKEVAHQLLVDALSGRFLSTVGFEGFILTTLCAGMGPLGSTAEVFLQVCLMSLLRLVSIGYLLNFARIIRNYREPLGGKKAQ